jgi:hypothetical protein
MYQFYAFNKKAYEIIKRTTDILTEMINDIKQLIDQYIYKIEYNKLAHCITESITGNFNNFAEQFYELILK